MIWTPGTPPFEAGTRLIPEFLSPGSKQDGLRRHPSRRRVRERIAGDLRLST